MGAAEWVPDIPYYVTQVFSPKRSRRVAAVTLPFRSLWQTGHRLKHPAARRLPEVRLRGASLSARDAVDRFTGFLMARFGCVLDERSETRGQRPRYAQRPVFGPQVSPIPSSQSPSPQEARKVWTRCVSLNPLIAPEPPTSIMTTSTWTSGFCNRSKASSEFGLQSLDSRSDEGTQRRAFRRARHLSSRRSPACPK